LLGASSVAMASAQWSGHLLELSIAYGDAQLDTQSCLVRDAAGVPDVAKDSPGYAVALLEHGGSVERARVVWEAVLAQQDKRGKSPTRGCFKWSTASEDHDPGTLIYTAPMLARAYSSHAAALGDACAAGLKEAMELEVEALSQEERRSEDEEALIRHGALATLGAALGRPQYVTRAVEAVTEWVKRVGTQGRHWPPSPTRDALRILALGQIWGAAAQADRAIVEQALILCYKDFAQRVHFAVPALAGGIAADGWEAAPGHGLPAYLIYRDFGGQLAARVRPFAVAFALCPYQVPEAIVALVRPDFTPYSVETNSSEGRVSRIPARTDTFMDPAFTLGTMTGWCTPDSLPTYVTFGREQADATAYFAVHDGPAHVSSLQARNFAICSFNFDRMGVGNRVLAWVEGVLGGARDVQEVWALGSAWNGQPIAVPAGGTVVVRRGGVYMGVTLLESGPPGVASTTRRKPGILEWKAVGEDAHLTLSVYGRQEDFQLKDAIDDVRAGFVIQLWDGDEVESIQDLAAWMDTSQIKQTYAPMIEREVLPGQEPSVLDKDKPRPRDRYKVRTQKVHTITYAYRRGKGDVYELVEDLEGEVVLSRTGNGTELGTGFWWDSPGLTMPPGIATP